MVLFLPIQRNHYETSKFHRQFGIRSVARVPGKDVESVLAYASTQPNGVNWGNGGAGGLAHLTIAHFASRAGMNVTHIPYNGNGPAFRALLGGDIDFLLCAPSAQIRTWVSERRVKMMAVTSPETSPLFPDVKPISHFIPGFASELLHGIVAPPGTPADVIDPINSAFTKVLSDKSIQARFMENFCIASPSTPAEYAQAITAELNLSQDIIKQTGVKLT